MIDQPTDSSIHSYSPPNTQDTVGSEPLKPSDGGGVQPVEQIAERLEDQNIFNLLGVTDGTDEEKEAFLDELQQVIWEDFLENDVELLVTANEMEQVNTILTKENVDDLEKQEELVVYLEKLIPELEEIMLEKALELKEEMVRERLMGMKEFHAGKQNELDTITQAESFIQQDKWKSGVDLLNSIT